MSTFGSLADRFALYGSFVRFAHTVFAMPFALAMMLVVSETHEVTFGQLLWILVALVAARSAAMGYNRIVDCDIDRANARTAGRELPAGKLSLRGAKIFVSIWSVLFLLAAGMLGMHCLVLAPLVLVVLGGYSWMKRVSAGAHLVLGLALALAPGGVWYALTARFAWEPVWLMGAVLLWVAGFDVLYSLQDLDFDRKSGLRSIPALLGPKYSFVAAGLMHLIAVLLLVGFGTFIGLGRIYFLGLAVFAGLLANQHYSLWPGRIDRIDGVFFTRNGLASVLFFLGVMGDLLSR